MNDPKQHNINYKFSDVFIIKQEYLKLFYDLNRGYIDELQQENSKVRIRRMNASTAGYGYSLASNSLLAIEEVKQKLYQCLISVENEWEDIKFQKRLYKERQLRQRQFEAAENIKRHITTELKIRKETEPEELQEELNVGSTQNTLKKEQSNISFNKIKNKFSLLEIEDDD